ncbi:NFACT RNA binding domain-containing protein [Desulfovibrio inopinatus]|uniref:NFACT RNA binding domain-containing protein n=1 Tax=Desulfovibrio inopinatus TaxID=102109 RepID=UPI0004030812|nr:NFACT RNA binding domain-containing protein [Desulfovibrio inopinatus]
MEANFFRHLAGELAGVLAGARIEKIQSPQANILTLTVSVLREHAECMTFFQGRPKLLVFEYGGRQSLLFFTDHKPPNPASPPAAVMWLRKRLRGRRLGSAHYDWPGRRLAFELSEGQGSYLVFDCKNGLSLVDTLDAAFDNEVCWPALENVLSNPDIWREYQQISPILRKNLATDPEGAAGLYRGLVEGRADRFYITMKDDRPDLALNFLPVGFLGETAQVFDSALEAACVQGQAIVFGQIGETEAKEDVQAERTAAKRQKKRLKRIEAEESRLLQLQTERAFADAIAANLDQIDPSARMTNLTLSHPDHGTVDVVLDPALTVVENMERFYRHASKGKRGLAHIDKRRQAVLAGKDEAAAYGRSKQPVHDALPSRYKGEAVRLFKTDDDFMVLRGKNDKANHRLLSRLSSPFDLWFHVEGGPGAHVILKRDHPGQDVPRRSLEQAAVLAGLSSFRKNDAKAEVIVALVKNVRTVKGAAMGQASVDVRLETVFIDLDPALEKRLLVS